MITKAFKVIGIAVFIPLFSFFSVAIFLPDEVKVDKKVEIETPLINVFYLVNDFNEWKKWMPWTDTTVSLLINGGETGKGIDAMMLWVDNKEKVGARQIIKADFLRLIVVETCNAKEQSKSIMRFNFKELASGNSELKITMKIDKRFSYPFGRYVAWMIQGSADESFEKALENIKTLAEK
ncbi:MAG: hypothetical protein AUJ98_05235 [Bacteroidetes bacterium CG2_30_33_31]|nr:MAG: hypothetical protein AUJ98_05235 [Bacteroidetes bacterium CG2_30_33_31]